jgi:TfoX/Sxy family transcriptional regulator of competence genes
MNLDEFKKNLNDLSTKILPEQKALVQKTIDSIKLLGFQSVITNYDFLWDTIRVVLEYGFEKVEDFLETAKTFDETSIKSLITAYQIYFNKLLNSTEMNSKIYLLSTVDTYSQKLSKHIMKFVIFDGQKISIPMVYIQENNNYQKLKNLTSKTWYQTNIIFNDSTMEIPDEIKIAKLDDEKPDIKNILSTQFQELTTDNLYSAINSNNYYFVDAILVEKYRDAKDNTLYRVFLTKSEDFLTTALYIAINKNLNIPLRTRIYALTTLMSGKQNSTDVVMFPVYVESAIKELKNDVVETNDISELDFYNGV